MTDLFSKVEEFFIKYNLHEKKRIAVAFSGGFDSMCLLNVTNKLSEKFGFELYAIHLNHNWRGQESLKEANNCENFCKNNNIKFYSEVLSPDCPQTETAAREARYDFFKASTDKFNLDAVLTAHNANDNAETVLYRISKGTGIIGLSAIQEQRENYYRPLLNIKRYDIEKYCKVNKLEPNIDSSNSNTKYKRNLIRQKVLPHLENINKNAIDAINSLSNIAKEENEIIQEYLSVIRDKITHNGEFLTDEFTKQSTNIQKRFIYEILTENGLDYDAKTILKLLNFIEKNKLSKSSKKTSLNSEKFLSVNSHKICVVKKVQKNSSEIIIPKEGKYNFAGYEFSIKKCKNAPDKFPKDEEMTAFCTLKDIQFPLTLRFRKEGDYFTPLGLNGTQKLKKFFISKKIEENKRDKIVLLAKDKEVLWVSGYAINDKIKVVQNADYMLKLRKK